MSEPKTLTPAFLSTYPPKACGIATFTQDLIQQLKLLPQIRPFVAALEDRPYSYGPEVRMTIPQQNRAAYAAAAEKLNHSGADLLVVEHEYGIFGGADGEYLLDLIEGLRIPFVVTLHTVLASPSRNQRRILHLLGQKARRIVTMAHNTISVLQSVYGIERDKITVIPHGVPRRPRQAREELKRAQDAQGRFVVSTFGLLSSGKGLEYGIRAVGQVARNHPDVLYYILGRTHPVVYEREGDAYRHSLEELVRKLRLTDHVRFVNRYLSKDEIIRYLEMSDLYMTPYLGREQAVSGTLAYAAGYGRVIVSTPYPYARELLGEGRGLLAEFRDADSLANRIAYVIEHPAQKKEMEREMLRYGTQMFWNEVADRYCMVFEQAAGISDTGRIAV